MSVKLSSLLTIYIKHLSNDVSIYNFMDSEQLSMEVDWLSHRLRSLRKQVIRQPLTLKEANNKIVQVNKETEEELEAMTLSWWHLKK